MPNNKPATDVATFGKKFRLSGLTGCTYKLTFSPDNTRLMVVANDPSGLVQDTVRVYVLPTKDIIALAKSRPTRSLTTEECQQYLHVDTCPAVP